MIKVTHSIVINIGGGGGGAAIGSIDGYVFTTYIYTCTCLYILYVYTDEDLVDPPPPLLGK